MVPHPYFTLTHLIYKSWSHLSPWSWTTIRGNPNLKLTPPDLYSLPPLIGSNPDPYLLIPSKSWIVCKFFVCIQFRDRLLSAMTYFLYQWVIKSIYILIQVYIKEIFINSVRKNFVPFWIDSNVDIENDPYTTDCSDQTNTSNPHAYTHFTITNGKLSSRNCIKKLPGDWFLRMSWFNRRSENKKKRFSILGMGIIFWMQYNLWKWRKDQN